MWVSGGVLIIKLNYKGRSSSWLSQRVSKDAIILPHWKWIALFTQECTWPWLKGIGNGFKLIQLERTLKSEAQVILWRRAFARNVEFRIVFYPLHPHEPAVCGCPETWSFKCPNLHDEICVIQFFVYNLHPVLLQEHIFVENINFDLLSFHVA
jgi:hypothetical protein